MTTTRRKNDKRAGGDIGAAINGASGIILPAILFDGLDNLQIADNLRPQLVVSIQLGHLVGLPGLQFYRAWIQSLFIWPGDYLHCLIAWNDNSQCSTSDAPIALI